MPIIEKNPNPTSTVGKPVEYWWTIDDMWKFDNVGFSTPVSEPNPEARKFKFVICGGCNEFTVLGLQYTDCDDTLIYVDPSKVLYS